MGDESLIKLDHIFSKYKDEIEREQKDIEEEEQQYAYFRIDFDKMAKETIHPILTKMGERLKCYGARFEIIELPPEPHDGIKKLSGISLKIDSMPIKDHLELFIKALPSPGRHVVVTLVIGGNPVNEPKEFTLHEITTPLIENFVLELVEKSFEKRQGL